MNIKKLFTSSDKKDKEIYAGSFTRTFAAGIDVWIVMFLRGIFLQASAILFLNDEVQNFAKEFGDYFGTANMKFNIDHINFLMNHRIFYISIFIYAFVIFIGAFYHAYLNSSAWRGTIGKRLMKIMIIKNDMSPITIWRGFAHYFLSILPFAFVLYLIVYQLAKNMTLLQAISDNPVNVFLGIIFVLWVQLHLFTKKSLFAWRWS